MLLRLWLTVLVFIRLFGFYLYNLYEKANYSDEGLFPRQFSWFPEGPIDRTLCIRMFVHRIIRETNG